MDWVLFLEDNGIPYVTRGKNTKRGEVSIQCPWCGDDDPSEHLGISLTEDNWGCYRSSSHRGHKPLSLVAALLGCSFGQARIIVDQYSRPDPETLDQAIATLSHAIQSGATQLHPTPTHPSPPSANLTIAQFHAIKQHNSTGKFWRYLSHRGFPDVQHLVDRYSLKCALTGAYKDRVIIPFYQNHILLGWTGRAIIDPVKAPRYLSSGETVKTTVFNEDKLQAGGDTLFIVEGPFDALKLDYYGEPAGARATCVFGVTMTLPQIDILNQVRKRFNRVIVLFDDDALAGGFEAADWLQAANVSLGELPAGIKDPGEMTEGQIRAFVKNCKKRH